jgi:hypothetical protein
MRKDAQSQYPNFWIKNSKFRRFNLSDLPTGPLEAAWG